MKQKKSDKKTSSFNFLSCETDTNTQLQQNRKLQTKTLPLTTALYMCALQVAGAARALHVQRVWAAGTAHASMDHLPRAMITILFVWCVFFMFHLYVLLQKDRQKQNKKTRQITAPMTTQKCTNQNKKQKVTTKKVALFYELHTHTHRFTTSTTRHLQNKN